MAKKTEKCKSCGGSGVLFFSYSGVDNYGKEAYSKATIERCDSCKRFKNDHTASKAVEKIWKKFSK